ncbi:MAG TPA: sigma-70 family RNA polymerase sigma factor [Actinocrinis sp.]
MERQNSAGQDEGVGVADLVDAAVRGSHAAWNGLVDRYARLVWSVARTFRLSDADAADVCQTTWLRLVENLDRIADPERLGSWLATTARRECIAVLRRRDREAPVSEAAWNEFEEPEAPGDGPEARIITQDENKQLWDAFSGLSERCRNLLRVLAAVPKEGKASYAQISAALGIPTGSIGPTRARCLEQLRGRINPVA